MKKKGVPEQPPNNPPKDSMTKLGTCTITVEPHIFDATMYAIKDPNSRPTPTPVSQQPMYRPIIQYGPPHGTMPPPAPIPPTQQQQFPVSQMSTQASPKTQDKTTRNPMPPTSTPNYTPTPSIPQTNSLPHAQNPTPTNPNGAQLNTPHPPPPPPAPAPAPVDPADKSKDPVIQMLAERASTDPDLKALMRIVANGQASPEELKRFQSHIDDLTRLQKARQAAIQAQSTSQPSPHPPQASLQINGHAHPTPSPSPSVRNAPAQVPTPKSEHQFQSQPQALRSKGPVPSTKPDISGVVFEFAGGSGDRFLFPKFSILEYLPQGQVIASFLIVRKGSCSDSPAYDPALDYYQPITIRLYAHQGRQLEALQKIVAPPDEVRRYMDDIMDNMTRAEYVLLAMRLPRDIEQAPPPPEKTDDVEKERPNQLDNQVLWATTNPRPAPKAKPAKRLLTEEEKYHSFINTVSSVN